MDEKAIINEEPRSSGLPDKKLFGVFFIVQAMCSLIMAIASCASGNFRLHVAIYFLRYLDLPMILAIVAACHAVIWRKGPTKPIWIILLISSLLVLLAAYSSSIDAKRAIRFDGPAPDELTTVYVVHMISTFICIPSIAFSVAGLNQRKDIMKDDGNLPWTAIYLLGVGHIVAFLANMILVLIMDFTRSYYFDTNLYLYAFGQYHLPLGVSILTLNLNAGVTKYKLMNVLITSVIALITSIPLGGFGIYFTIRGFDAFGLASILFSVIQMGLSITSLTISSIFWKNKF